MRFFQIGRETVCQNCYEAYPVIGIELDMEQVERPEEIRCAYCLADEPRSRRVRVSSSRQAALERRATQAEEMAAHLYQVTRAFDAAPTGEAWRNVRAALLRYERLYPETRVQT